MATNGSANGAQDANRRTFTGRLYSGGEFSQFWGRAIIDLDGLQIPSNKRPVLHEHGMSASGANPNLGYTTAVRKSAAGVDIDGVFLTNKGAQDVIRDADDGFPWELSIRATILQEEVVGPGQTVTVNGRTITGPIVIGRRSILREATICSIGADPHTRFNMAATGGRPVRSAADEDGDDDELIPASRITAEWVKRHLPGVAAELR